MDFEGKQARDFLINIGGRFARSPIFYTRSTVFEDTLYHNLGSFKDTNETALHVLEMSLHSGDSRILKYTIPDSLFADRRHQPGSILRRNSSIFIKEGNQLIEFDFYSKELKGLFNVPKSHQLAYVNQECAILWDYYYAADNLPLSLCRRDVKTGDIVTKKLSLSYQELSFYGISELVVANDTAIFVADLGSPKVTMLDHQFKVLNYLEIKLDTWVCDSVKLANDKNVKALKKKDVFEYGNELARIQSRVSKLKWTADGNLLMALVHPDNQYENILISPKDGRVISRYSSPTKDLSEEDETRDAIRAKYAYGIVDRNWLVSISPADDDTLKEHGISVDFNTGLNDYYLSIRVYE